MGIGKYYKKVKTEEKDENTEEAGSSQENDRDYNQKGGRGGFRPRGRGGYRGERGQ